MTLSSKLCKVIHQIDPTLTSYTFPFKIFKAHEAAVRILGPDGAEMVRLRIDGDYLVSGLESDSGGEIKLTESGLARAAKGHSLLIIRNMDFTQGFDYRPHDIFPAHSHERALDILTMQNQELLEMLKRAALVPIGRQPGDPWGEFTGLAGRAREAAEMAENASRGAADCGREAAASANAAREAALKAEKGLSSLMGHTGDQNAHEVLFGTKIRNYLTRDTTFYVRPDGNDGNDGQTDSASGALKTLAGADKLLRAIDRRGYKVTISLASGGFGAFTANGALSMGNGLIKLTSTDRNNLGFIALNAGNGAHVELGDIGIDVSFIHNGIVASTGSIVTLNGPIRFRGSSAGLAIQAVHKAYIRGNSVPLTFDNVSCNTTVACALDALIELVNGTSFSGNCNSRRYNVWQRGAVLTGSKGPDFIIGTAAGTVDTRPGIGGVYL